MQLTTFPRNANPPLAEIKYMTKNPDSTAQEFKDQDLRKTQLEGHQANLPGQSKNNPHPENSQAWHRWNSGWNDAERARNQAKDAMDTLE